MTPWTRRSLVAMLTATACGLAGCGSTAPPSAAPPSAAPPSAAPPSAGSAAPVTGTYTPHIDPVDFSSTVDNMFFPLKPGMQLRIP